MKKRIKFGLLLLSFAFCGCGSDSNTNGQSYTVVDGDSILNININGKLKEMYHVKGGQKNGLYRLFDFNGELTEEGYLKENDKEGIIKFFNHSKLTAVAYYEKNLKVYDLDRNDFIFDTIILAPFKMCIPKNWSTVRDPQENVLLVSKKACDSSEVFCPVFSITKEKANVELKDYVSKALNLMQMKVDKIKILQDRIINLYGFDVAQVRYMILKEGKTIGLQTGFLKINDDVFVLTGTALNDKEGEFLKYDGLFEEIILSVKINK